MTAGEPPRVGLLTLVPFDQVDLDVWHRLRDAAAELDSPYFHPGFAAAVHATGRDVKVVVVADRDDRVTGLMPVHRDRSVLSPLGSPAADFQGPLLAVGSRFPVRRLLSGGVRTFEFDHLATGVADFAPWIESCRVSPFLDVSGGFEAYLGRASRSGRANMAQARRHLARAERTLGPVSFRVDNPDAGVLAKLIELKRRQYAATGARDYFGRPDRVELMSRLLRTRSTEFGGILSTLCAGPHLLAAHFGIRSDRVLHWWFPVYDPAYAQLAPGWMLLRELVIAASTVGVERIDLGRGEDEYKRRAKTGETQVFQGMVTRSMRRRAVRAGLAALSDSPLGPPARRLVREFRSRECRPGPHDRGS
ncbi:GNAT family N-acetyltransferase [Rhodococcus sp. NPDC003318]|uniref:GNAT family N-acetyltransferase n=1 Tax=Rhodococcus sp. NPDC003318 TaxID=3364503 RepID=UPI00369EA439